MAGHFGGGGGGDGVKKWEPVGETDELHCTHGNWRVIRCINAADKRHGLFSARCPAWPPSMQCKGTEDRQPTTTGLPPFHMTKMAVPRDVQGASAAGSAAAYAQPPAAATFVRASTLAAPADMGAQLTAIAGVVARNAAALETVQMLLVQLLEASAKQAGGAKRGRGHGASPPPTLPLEDEEALEIMRQMRA